MNLVVIRSPLESQKYACAIPRMVAERELFSSIVKSAFEENNEISTLQMQDSIKMTVEMIRNEITKTIEKKKQKPPEEQQALFQKLCDRILEASTYSSVHSQL